MSILVTSAACATATSDHAEREAPDSPDGGGGAALPDAAVAVPADAMPAHNDPPDAGPVEPTCTDQTVNFLNNPNFDNGLGAWAQSSSGGYQLIMNQSDTGITAHSGVMVAWLSGYDDAVDSIAQNAPLPADARNVTVKGQRHFTTDESGGTYDRTWLEITDPAGNVLETLATWSNQDVSGDWVAFEYALAGNYQGQTIKVRLRSDTDYSNPSWFFYDTLRLEATTCQ
jgi:hypothetical protein